MNYKYINFNGAYVGVTKDGSSVIFKGKERTIGLNKDGYKVVSLKTNKGWRSIGVHRLVANAFLPNPNNLPEVNHKDYNRTNNDVKNLEWVTHHQNIIYSML